jgi:hypothetical protein
MLFAIVPAGKIKVVELQVDAELSGCSVHDTQSFGHDFLANAISWNHGNAVLGHGYHFLLKKAIDGLSPMAD